MLDAFATDNRKNGDGKQYWCKGCINQRQRELRISQPKKEWARRMRSHFKLTYGISLEDYEAMLAAQGNKCKICGGQQTAGRRKMLYVDHSHKTGRVRGLLCHHCNLILAHARDTVEILRKAITYLQEL